MSTHDDRVIEWYTGEYEGYGASPRDGGFDVWRADGSYVGWAGNEELAAQMAKDDE